MTDRFSGTELMEFLTALGEASQKFGIKIFKCQDVEVVFTNHPPIEAPQRMQTQPIGAPYGMPTEDELLFASSIPLTEDEMSARAPA